MRAVGSGEHDIAADEMPLVAATPLQIKKVVAMERERPQQDDVTVHPQPAMLVQYGIAEEVAEIADLRAGEDALEQPSRHDIVGRVYLDPLRQQEFELFG